MPSLFDQFALKGVTLRNRIGVSPMCQYSYSDGFSNDWQLVHLGSRAVGGAGLVIVEASAVEDRGRITPGDLGIWKNDHIAGLSRIATFLKSQGAVAGIQIAHAGRKASTFIPWEGNGAIPQDNGGWIPIAPSPIQFDRGFAMPKEMTLADIAQVRSAFVAAAKRADAAGFQWLEIHAAHGYLAHSFLSPLSNHRTDEYGGSFDNRVRFLRETTREVRKVWPEDKPLTVRLSCTDWAEGGWDIEGSVELSQRLRSEGVDLIDCSSGGLVPHAKIELGPGYQVPFAEAIRSRAQIATAAVGLITDYKQADEIIASGKADVVLLARQMLREPYFAIHAAQALGQRDCIRTPVQYGRAFQ